MKISKENRIRNAFKDMGKVLAEQMPFNPEKWNSLSQYGYCLSEDHTSKLEAEQTTIRYYSDKMQLIDQRQDFCILEENTGLKGC